MFWLGCWCYVSVSVFPWALCLRCSFSCSSSCVGFHLSILPVPLGPLGSSASSVCRGSTSPTILGPTSSSIGWCSTVVGCRGSRGIHWGHFGLGSWCGPSRLVWETAHSCQVVLQAAHYAAVGSIGRPSAVGRGYEAEVADQVPPFV